MILSPFDLTLIAVAFIAIGAVAVFNIYTPWVDDGLAGRLLYMASALSCFVGLLNLENPRTLTAVIITLICLFALRQVRNMVLRFWRYQRYGRIHRAHHKR